HADRLPAEPHGRIGPDLHRRAGRRQVRPVSFVRHLEPHAALTGMPFMSNDRPRALARIVLLLLSLLGARAAPAADNIRGSPTYRAELAGSVGVVAAGRHYAAEAGMRMLARGGNAIDAGVAATFVAAVTEISHFGLGGEAPIIVHAADRREVVVINGQGPAPARAARDVFARQRTIPANGPSAGTVPAVVDALAIALAEFGTLSLGDVLAPAIECTDGFTW